MAETNPTERRLLDSIRKAKAGQPAQREEGRTSPAIGPARQPAQATRSAATRSRTAQPERPKTEVAGRYRSGRRVWPD